MNVEQTILLAIVGMVLFIAESNARVVGVAKVARLVVTPVVTLLLPIPMFVYRLLRMPPTIAQTLSVVCQIAILKRLTLGSTAMDSANAVPVASLTIAEAQMFTSESTAIV